MFKNADKRSNIKYRNDRRQYRTLPHIYICVAGSKKNEFQEY